LQAELKAQAQSGEATAQGWLNGDEMKGANASKSQGRMDGSGGDGSGDEEQKLDLEHVRHLLPPEGTARCRVKF
jgi:hypothetical protein